MNIRAHKRALIWLAICGVSVLIVSKVLYEVNSSEELSFVNSVSYSLNQHPEFIRDVKLKAVQGWQDIDESTSAQIVKRMLDANVLDAGPVLRWRLNSKVRSGKLRTMLTIQVSVGEDGKQNFRVSKRQ